MATSPRVGKLSTASSMYARFSGHMSSLQGMSGIRFTVQRYQTDAVVETFAGQPKHDGIFYRIDPGTIRPVTASALFDFAAQM